MAQGLTVRKHTGIAVERGQVGKEEEVEDEGRKKKQRLKDS